MRILLTGGAGFIGSHLTKRLLQEGHDVAVIDNLSTGKRDNIPTQADFIELDLSEPDFITKLPSGPFDAVCHLAAQSSGEISGENPLYDLQANAASTLVLSRWCLDQRIKRFLYASSMALYGNVSQTELPVNETYPCVPLSYYGVSKLTSENLLRVVHPKLSVTSFRMFSVYGPGQNLGNLKQGMVSIFLAYMLKGVPVPVTGSLDRFRDFVYIDDVIDLWMRAFQRPETPSLAYNVGSGKPTTVRTLLSQLIKASELPADYLIQEKPGYASDQFGLYADIRKATLDLDWHPKTTLEEGLKRMVRWARPEVLR